MEFQIRPLLPLTPIRGRPFPIPPLSDERYSQELVEKLVSYLCGGVCMIPWMGESEDRIGGKFETFNGYALYTDGVYYWRLDAADYVEHYPIRIDEEALEYFISRNWAPPSFSDIDPIVSAIETAYDSYPKGEFPVDGVITVRYSP